MDKNPIKSNLLQTLRQRGYKVTPQRNAIIDIISEDRSHPGAHDIFRKARRKLSAISISTVYSTLDLFKREGLVKELEFYDMENRYEADISDHINLVCMKCGAVQDLHSRIPIDGREVEYMTGFRPLRMRFEYYGWCRECRRSLILGLRIRMPSVSTVIPGAGTKRRM